MGNRKVQTFPLRLESTSTVDSRLVDKWLDLSILRLDTARSSAVADLNTGSSWSFTTFMNRPLVETSPGRYIPIRTQLVALKATTAGMYYTVFDLLKDADEDHLRWARFMGHVVEAHGHELLKTLLPNEATVTRPEEETRSQKRNPPKACDAMVEINGDVIALDFVHRNLTLLTQATGDIGDLETDLERAIQEKVVQIDATLERHLRADCGVDRIYPLVITGAPLPLNPMVSELLDRMIRATNPRVVTVDTRCRKVGVLELLELRMLLRTASQNGMSIADLLDRWYSTPLGRNNFRDWIVQTDLSVGRTQVDDGWEQRALAILE